MHTDNLPDDWETVLADEFAAPYFAELAVFVAAERAAHTVYPTDAEVFNALRTTPLRRVRAVILGQDPYHGEGQAHGLAFSVPDGVKPPPSLQNIFKELHRDLEIALPMSGNLTPWAEKGVLLLNTVLTVRAGQPLSHRGKGWETFTDAILRAVNAKPEPVVFLLWGKPAQQKTALLHKERHAILPAAHPSPLSARHGFFGSRPFSRANQVLRAANQPEIDWRLP